MFCALSDVKGDLSMGILVGIDEAGYGPLLGPLTVSAAAIRMSDEQIRGDHWGILKKAISKEKRSLKGRLLIADSKKAYNRKAGPVHLRRTVLAVLKCLENAYPEVPVTARELANVLCAQCAPRLDGYEWYKGLDTQKLRSDCGDIGIAANVLRTSLRENDMQILTLKSRCLDVGYYNKMVENVKNKSRVLFTSIAGLIQESLDLANEGEELQIVVDRQGGRARYGDLLRRMFGGMELSVIREDEIDSSYELRGVGKTMRIHFVVKADAKCMPVCLASMTSKYLREVMIESLNDYFVAQCDKIKPTAGYWQDGLRFVEEVKAHLPGVEYDEQKLVRSR